MPAPHFRPSAFRHGVTRERIIFALDRPIAYFRDEGQHDVMMIVGPDESGGWLEVGVMGWDTARRVVIHAMRARAKYRKLIKGR